MPLVSGTNNFTLLSQVSPTHNISCFWRTEECSAIILVLSMNSLTLSAYSHQILWCLACQDLSRLQEDQSSLPLHCSLFRHGLWCVLILQPPWWEPVAQTSSAVMMVGASHPPGSVMETMTVGTWVMRTRDTTVVSDPHLVSSLLRFLLSLFFPYKFSSHLRVLSSSSLSSAILCSPLLYFLIHCRQVRQLNRNAEEAGSWLMSKVLE